jgi:para-aminobenzoate synthetase / 4-amino-4-deoxychorismate lyase
VSLVSVRWAGREPRPVARPFLAPLDGAADPAGAARWLRGEPHGVALSGDWAGGGLLLSSHPLYVAGADADPFALLDFFPVSIDVPHTAQTAGPVVGGGWLGWWGFELARRLERLTPAPPDPDSLRPFDLAFHDHLIRCDTAGQWWFEALWSEERDSFLRERLKCWSERLAGPSPDGEPFTVEPMRVRSPGARGHGAAVAEGIARIGEGQLSQTNLCLRLDGRLSGDLLDLWVRADQVLAPPHAAFIGGNEHTIASLSPELFLRRTGRRVETRPIKGTAPMATDPARLAASEKDRAENVMIVDLMRNDLGRVCEYGTVLVPELCAVKPAAAVWHLVSTVTGRLRPDVTDGELLRATFPPGSVSGAPKIEAERVIHELESTARGAYCGAIGLCSPLAGLELSVAIRTFEAHHDRLWLGAGGGIVADSHPDTEVAEALTKARGVAAAAGIEIRGDAPSEPVSPLPRPVRLPRPDPAAGVIETMAITTGRPLHLEQHLDRLSNSCRQLEIPLPPELQLSIHDAAAKITDGALRVHVTRERAEVSVRARPRPEATGLTPVTLPGGLGAHKWADRTMIDALSSPTSTPLFCDLDGNVLEAGYAAVLILTRGAIIAPPLDGRILDSLSRRHLLDAARHASLPVSVRSFTVDEARQADAVLLSSSLRGPHPGLLPGGPPAGAAAEVCAQLSRAAQT